MPSLTKWITDLLWPLECLGCHRDGVRLCAECVQALPRRTTQDCVVCARPASNGIPCTPCRPHTSLERLIAAGSFRTPLLAQAIHTFKYQNAQDLAEPLGDWLTSVAADADITATRPLIVPVPLHLTRLKERGYNQATLLAKRLARASLWPLESESLIRARHTEMQSKTASRWERLENMRDSFLVTRPHPITDADIMLIDDVSTTGATLNAAAEALLTAGASSVTGIVLARS